MKGGCGRKKIKIAHIVGARPNFVKIVSIIDAFKKYDIFEQVLIHTGQHFDHAMSGSFFKDLNIGSPDISFSLCNKRNAHRAESLFSGRMGDIMLELEKCFIKMKPDLVLVVGDVDSTFAATFVASRLQIPVAHVEAGLRSFDRSMPEEINRILTDTLATYLFITSPEAEDNLIREGVDKRNIFFAGNPMIDSLLRFKKTAEQTDILSRLNLAPQKYALLTLHRPSNVDNKKELEEILATVRKLQHKLKFVFPVHPRTMKNIKKFKLQNYILNQKNIIVLGPMRYLDFIHLISKANLIMTDSGGIQEESVVLGVPCLTLRRNTERPVTMKNQLNSLVGGKKDDIIRMFNKIVAEDKSRRKTVKIKYWDGKASLRIAKILYKKMAC